jgi:5'-nucleotidase
MMLLQTHTLGELTPMHGQSSSPHSTPVNSASSSPNSTSPKHALLATVTVTAVALTVGMSGLTPVYAAGPVVVDILTINDFHGRIEANGVAAGAAVLSGAVNGFREGNPNTLVVSAGDNIGASTFTSFIQQDAPTLDVLNAIDLDVSAVGNHEFDRGFADLAGRVTDGSNFPYLGANVYDTATGQPTLPEYFIKKVEGISVGFIGAVTEELPSLVSPGGLIGHEIRDIPTEVNRVAANLRDGDASNGEADAIILLLHEGAVSSNIADATNDSAFGTVVNGINPTVDAIVSAHTHQSYNHVINDRPVIQAGKYGEKFGHITLSVDKLSGEVASITSEVLPLTNNGTVLYPDDSAIVPIVTEATHYAEERGSQKVGEITANFTRARQIDGTENRGGASTLSNFVADVQLWATQETGTEIAFMNPGGVRADLTYESTDPQQPNGTLTYRSVAAVQPYANTLITLTLTGAQIRGVLEEQWQPPEASRPFLKLGTSQGLTYISDPAASPGKHISHLSLNGKPIADHDTHKVVVNAFLATGGDNFMTFASGTEHADSGRVDLQAMVDYVSAHPINTPDTTRRSIGVHLSTSGGNVTPLSTYKPGETITAELSSLLYSAEPVGDIVTVSIGNTTLSSATINPTVTNSTDETGRATVVFTIPRNLTGIQQLTIAVPHTGTQHTIPLTISPPDIPITVNH